jgi:hypothetical protein
LIPPHGKRESFCFTCVAAHPNYSLYEGWRVKVNEALENKFDLVKGEDI